MIYTIGHSTHPWDEFVSLLDRNRIQGLVDVRSAPTSRHCPQFNGDHMATALRHTKHHYVHLPSLGGHRKLDPSQPGSFTTVRNRSFRAYAQYTATEPFAEGIEDLLAWEADLGVVAIMCAEALWWRCHRRIIAEHLSLYHDHTVLHIGSDGALGTGLPFMLEFQ